MESKYKYVGGSFSGSKLRTKQCGKIYRDVNRYYGVTQEDIDNKTRRYKEFVAISAAR